LIQSLNSSLFRQLLLSHLRLARHCGLHVLLFFLLPLHLQYLRLSLCQRRTRRSFLSL